MRHLLLALLLIAAPARADVAQTLDAVILPGIAAFQTEAAALAATAAADCRRDAVLPAYHRARDAWGRIGDFRLGPTEHAALTIAFWPDDRASGARALRRVLEGDAALPDGAGVALLPASARGFAGLDLLLGDPGLDDTPGGRGCALVVALGADLAAQAAALAQGWAAHAELLRHPGAAGNLTYLDEADARRALYTQALAGVQLTRDARLGRPLGEPGRPRPARAEGWRTGRALPNARIALRAAQDLAESLAGEPLPQARAALAAVEQSASAIADPGFQDLADPEALRRLARLRHAVDWLHAALSAELGARLGLAPGFNAHDGD